MSSSPTDGRISLGSAMSGSPVARQHHCCRIDPLPPSLPAFGKQAHRPAKMAPVIGCGEWLARLRFRHRPVVSDRGGACGRSEEHTSELQSLMRISYAVFCLNKKTKDDNQNN